MNHLGQAILGTVSAAGEAGFSAALAETRPTGPRESAREFDARWDAAGWPAGAGDLPGEQAALLTSAAGSALSDLGELAAQGRGAVTALPVARYIFELCSDVLWLLEPGTGPWIVETPDKALERFNRHRQERVSRAWSYRLETAAHYVDSRPRDASFRAELTQWRLAVPKEIRTEIPSLRQRSRLLDDAMTDRRTPDFPPLYDFFSASSHPNPHALAEVSAHGAFAIAYDDLAMITRVTCITFGAAWQMWESYSGWPGEDVEHWLDAVDASLPG